MIRRRTDSTMRAALNLRRGYDCGPLFVLPVPALSLDAVAARSRRPSFSAAQASLAIISLVELN